MGIFNGMEWLGGKGKQWIRSLSFGVVLLEFEFP